MNPDLIWWNLPRLEYVEGRVDKLMEVTGEEDPNRAK